MTDRFFAERGIFYRTNGFDPNKQTMVFVHGLSGSSSAWTRYAEAFSDAYNIVTFDLRGHGKSAKPTHRNNYRIESFVDDLRALLEHLSIDHCVLISHSFGTLIALDFILAHPGIVSGAIFLSPNFAIRQRLLARAVSPLAHAIDILDRTARDWRPGTHIDYANHPDTGDWNIRRMIADVGNTGLRVYLYCTYHSCLFDRMHRLRSIDIPVLIMHGTKDTIFPVSASHAAADRIPNATLTVLADTDHIIVLNRFPEVSAAIRDFASRIAIPVKNRSDDIY